MPEMTQTQRAAEAWLRAQGRRTIFQRRRSPDFIMPNGEGFVAKLVRHNAVVFSARQLAELRAFGPATLLLFAAGASEPEAVVVVDQLDVPGYWRQYRLVLTDLSRRAA